MNMEIFTIKRIAIGLGVVLVLALLLLHWYTQKTPKIMGMVVDANTELPVEDARVSTRLDIQTSTRSGDSIVYVPLERTHIRTDEYGRFTIPSRKLKKLLPAGGSDSEAQWLRIDAETLDDRGGEVNYYINKLVNLTDKQRDGDLKKLFSKRLVSVVIYIEPMKRKIGDYSNYLHDMENVCLGLLSPERGGCDDWELDYTIKKHESFLKKLGKPKTGEQVGWYSRGMGGLAALYKKKGDYKTALATHRKLKDYKKKRGFSFKGNEFQIKELEELLQKEPVQ